LTSKNVLIIGAGIGGLSTGCYAQMNGYQTQIFEMHTFPGGQCTAWKRGNYVFDGCIHHLAGCKPSGLLYGMWEELGALPVRPLIFPEDMCQVEDNSGKRFTVYVDLDRLRQHMLELAPQDKQAIEGYIKAAKSFQKLDFLDTSLLNGTAFTKRFLKMASILTKYGANMTKYAEKFTDPFLRKAFPTIQYDWTETPMFIHLNMIGNCSSGNYAVPVGGSLEFSRAIEQRYLNLGGVIHYGKKVDKILVENDKAVGVRLRDGTEHRADIVVSDAFGYTTIFGLLDGKYLDDKIRKQYAKPQENMVMGIHVSLGVNRDLSKEPRALVLFLENPVTIADREHCKLDLELFGYDPSFAPSGKSVIKVLINTNYSYWKHLYSNKEKYRAEKQKVADVVITLLEKRFPGIKGQIEVVDIATPMTTERFTGVGQGFESNWGFSDAVGMMRGQPKTLPKLQNFYMVGFSVGGAGLPGCAAMGRNLVKKLCKQNGADFTASKP
jgi:phytoene dehydrogenase-like protein